MITDKSREVRKYLYAVLVAAGPLVSFYGLATSDEIALWLGLGGTLLGIPAGTTALANLTPKQDTTANPVIYVEGDDPSELIVEGAVATELINDDDNEPAEVEDPFADESEVLPSRRSLREE